MSEPLYSVGTYDMETQRYSLQSGLSASAVNVSWSGLRRVLRDLRGMGYEATRDDASVWVERTDGAERAEIIDSWARNHRGYFVGTTTNQTNAD